MLSPQLKGRTEVRWGIIGGVPTPGRAGGGRAQAEALRYVARRFNPRS